MQQILGALQGEASWAVTQEGQALGHEWVSIGSRPPPAAQVLFAHQPADLPSELFAQEVKPSLAGGIWKSILSTPNMRTSSP